MSDEVKAEQFLILKENFNNIGAYDFEDKSYIEYKRHEEKVIVQKKTAEDLIGELISLNGQEATIKAITYEMEGALAYSAYIETENNKNFRIKNNEHVPKDEFELEVILHLESILYKA